MLPGSSAVTVVMEKLTFSKKHGFASGHSWVITHGSCVGLPQIFCTGSLARCFDPNCVGCSGVCLWFCVECLTGLRRTVDSTSTNVGRNFDGSSTKAQRTLDGRSTQVRRTFDESLTAVRRTVHQNSTKSPWKPQDRIGVYCRNQPISSIDLVHMNIYKCINIYIGDADILHGPWALGPAQGPWKMSAFPVYMYRFCIFVYIHVYQVYRANRLRQ